MQHFLRIAPLALLAAAPLPALAQGSAENGQAIAQRWCASCHLVAPDQLLAASDAPTFASIAAESDGEFGWLAAFLADPHPEMPRMSLTRQQVRDLGAYLNTLRPEPEPDPEQPTEGEGTGDAGQPAAQ